MKILITGASGFIGSFIVDEVLRRGWETWAAVRPNSSRQYLTDPSINFINLNLDSEAQLIEALQSHAFDYVVHAAGATKCKNFYDFFRVNADGTCHLVNALLATHKPKKFVFVSSLSVFGAIREAEPHQDILASDTPQPNTFYGRSKLAAEQFLETVKDKLDYTILRPTGVYGPREKDYFVMVKSIKQHTDFTVGRRLQEITFVYVSDVVQAVFLAIERGEAVSGKAYFLTDGAVYESASCSQLTRNQLGKPGWIRLTLPVWVARVACTVCGWWSKLTGKLTPLNKDKYHILVQRNWRCDIQTTIDELGYQPQVLLEEGVRRSIEWYKNEGWI